MIHRASVQYQEEIQTPDARIISTAFIPQSPSFPRKRLVVAFAVPASLILGFMLALALERLENGFRIDTEIERHLPHSQPWPRATYVGSRAFSDLAESFGGFSFVVDCDSLDSTTLMEVSDDPALFC